MKRVFQLLFSLVIFAFGFSQNLKPIAKKVNDSKIANKSFVKYDLFTVDQSAQKMALYKAAAEDITVMKLNKSESSRIASERPEALEMTFPFEGKMITVELVKNNFFTHDFKVNTDKGYSNYSAGAYYQGIVKGDNESLVAISFFNDDVVGVTSIKDIGNIVIGKAKNSEDFVSYNDEKLKGANPFSCSADQLVENQNVGTTFDPVTMTAPQTSNCVRIYYEAGYGPYTQNGSNVTTTGNWVTAMHNNISTLYANDGITVALSEIYVWTSVDPYTGTPNEILSKFRAGRPSFNGDVAQLIRNPATTSIAYLDVLCTASNYSYSGVNFSYANVPTYSWNIMAMTHEIGHNLGSPHTHACRWNGDNTAIDGCGPASGNDEGCNAPLPGKGGTIMSYCHLVGSVGVNFSNGFGPQPAALIISRINSKGCLGTNCVTSCAITVAGLNLGTITKTSLTATIADNTGTSWKYRLSKPDGTIVDAGVTTNKILNFTGLAEGAYYLLAVGTDCTGPETFAYEKLFLTDADWCSGVKFTDSGGENSNYLNGQPLIKTFYPTNSNDKLKMTFTEFATEQGADYVIVYDGPNIGSTRFPGATNISGNTIPGPFESTHATGAITFRFTPNASNNAAGWVATFECKSLATGENSLKNGISISPTGAKGFFTIVSKDQILSYQIFDASGKMVKTLTKASGLEQKVDLSTAPVGTYIVNIVTAKETVTKKIIKK